MSLSLSLWMCVISPSVLVYLYCTATTTTTTKRMLNADEECELDVASERTLMKIFGCVRFEVW
jgi:hypothetical protein